ncbi:MAG: ABC transporter permease [Phycisphaerae bacterium]
MSRQETRQSGEGSCLLRLRGLITKEFLQIRRDPSSIAVAFLLPVILLLLFGYGVSLDAEDVPVAMVLEAPSPDAYSLVGAFEGSGYFRPQVVTSMAEARHLLRTHQVDGIVRVRGNFAKGLRFPESARIQVILNGVDNNTARIISGYAQGTWQIWARQWAADHGVRLRTPIRLEQRIRYNREVRSRNFLVPGLVAIIMTLIGAMLTALVMAREWQRGTMEAVLVSPVRMREILLGKLLPYFLLGMGSMALSTAMAVWLFDVPLRGSLWVLTACSALFLLAALGMGLLISSATRDQFVAGQTAILATFLPAFLLSGFVFEISSMPLVIQWITYLVPARYFVAILQTVFLTGDVWSVILPNSAALAAMAIVLLGATRLRSRKSLE